MSSALYMKNKFQYFFFQCLSGYCTSYPKISIFVLYLKIINNF